MAAARINHIGQATFGRRLWATTDIWTACLARMDRQCRYWFSISLRDM